ncbi:unnamed protein product [Ophioblennius macclurei]
MSSRKSTSSGEDLPSSRCVGRTPLRSLNNEIQYLSSSTPRFGPKAQLTDEVVKMTKGEAPVSEKDLWSDSSSPTKLIQASPPTTDMILTPTSCGLGDVTFKSFICAGGEVEISNSSHCAEDSIVLPQDQDTPNNIAEDTVTSYSTLQSYGDHEEHPYFNPEVKESYPVDVSEPFFDKFPNTPSTFGDLDETSRAPQGNESERDVTLKSFVCEGGEVEVWDTSRIQDDTIPLPKTELSEPSQDEAGDTTHFSVDCSQLCQEKHADHPYSATENYSIAVSSTSSETPDAFIKPADGLTDVTFKKWDCTGGEIEISEDTDSADQFVPSQACRIATTDLSYDCATQPSTLCDEDWHNDKDLLDHPYCTLQNVSCPLWRNLTVDPVKVESECEVMIDQTSQQNGSTSSSSFTEGGQAEKSDNSHSSEKTSSFSEDQFLVCQPVEANGCDSVVLDQVKDDFDEPIKQMENPEAASSTDPSINTETVLPDTAASDDEVVNGQVQEMSKYSAQHDISVALSADHPVDISNGSHLAASAESPVPVEVQQSVENVSQMNSTKGCLMLSGEKDSALGSSGNGPVQSNSEEKPFDVLKMLSDCPSGASALQLELLNPVVRRMSLCILKACGDLPQDHFSADDSALDDEKTLLTPLSAGLWADHVESPMPRPLFNSTTVTDKAQPSPVTEPIEDLEEKFGAVPQSEVKKPFGDVPMFPEGPLKQQLRQMAEFLFLASGKMGPGLASAAATAPPVRATPFEPCSVSVGTSPVKLMDHSINTSGQFERKREFSVVDSCTLTEPLLWNLNPGSLECLPRQELEQRLMSSMIMVEALVQQLASARSQQSVSAGCPPSDLREKLVQTDHTELSQTTMYRDVYMETLRRISELELDGQSLQNLTQQMQSIRVDMTSLNSDTDVALSKMKEIRDVVAEDHQSLVSHYGHMTSLFEKSKETHMRLTQRVKEALQQRDDMLTQMEDAVTAKEAAFSAMDQLRTHCATEISELKKSLVSQQELLVALKQVYPEQVSLNKACTETLNSASSLLSQTMDDQSSLINELVTVKSLLQEAAPMLLKMNEKAAAALRERDEHMCSRDQAVEEREQLEEELNETHSSLQIAKETIGDLNLQVTILTTETGVLQQKLNEKEEETGQLGRKVTELSATVSSTLASYTFLEQALTAESTKLEQSWQDVKEAKERASQLEMSLNQSERRVVELTGALAQSEEQLGQLQTLSQSQSAEIQHLQDLCTQLKGVREMNEFLLMENEVAREQVVESESNLRENLQGLRERNIQCEDLKGEVHQLQLENRTLHEELETTRSKASTTQLDLEENLAQAATEITLLLHTLRGLTNDLHATLSNQKPELQKDKAIVATSAVETQDDVETETTATSESTGVPKTQGEPLLSETSAFTCIAAVTSKKSLNEVRAAEEEEQSSVAGLLSELESTVRELVSTLKLVQQHKDTELLELHNTVGGLQVEHQAVVTRHEAEVSELKHQLNQLNHLMERRNQALQQKSQDEKTMMKLITDIQEAQEILSKFKTENNDLRKDTIELRRTLQQSKVESQLLRVELSKGGGQPMNQTQFMEEKIKLLKEVERLKASLQEVEQARVKLLERAKRHQIIHQNNQQKTENELQMLSHMINRIRETLLSLPEVVKNSEQLQQLLEYIG